MIQKAIFDVSRWDSRETAYDEMAEKLLFPDWFGRNLDALYDLLSADDYEITLTHTAEAPRAIRIHAMIRAIQEAGALKAAWPGNAED